MKNEHLFTIRSGILLIAALTILIVGSCERESLPDKSETQQETVFLTPIESAKMWYVENGYLNPVFLQPGKTATRATAENNLFFTQPSWKYYGVNQNENCTVIDVDLTDSPRSRKFATCALRSKDLPVAHTDWKSRAEDLGRRSAPIPQTSN